MIDKCTATCIEVTRARLDVHCLLYLFALAIAIPVAAPFLKPF